MKGMFTAFILIFFSIISLSIFFRFNIGNVSNKNNEVIKTYGDFFSYLETQNYNSAFNLLHSFETERAEKNRKIVLSDNESDFWNLGIDLYSKLFILKLRYLYKTEEIINLPIQELYRGILKFEAENSKGAVSTLTEKELQFSKEKPWMVFLQNTNPMQVKWIQRDRGKWKIIRGYDVLWEIGDERLQYKKLSGKEIEENNNDKQFLIYVFQKYYQIKLEDSIFASSKK